MSNKCAVRLVLDSDISGFDPYVTRFLPGQRNLGSGWQIFLIELDQLWPSSITRWWPNVSLSKSHPVGIGIVPTNPYLKRFFNGDSWMPCTYFLFRSDVRQLTDIPWEEKVGGDKGGLSLVSPENCKPGATLFQFPLTFLDETK